MPDVFTKAKRSEVMSRIRSRGNKDTELALAKLLRRHRIKGWRRHFEIRGRAVLPRGPNIRAAQQRRPTGAHGVTRPTFRVKPDFVFRQARLAMFVDGCFWHSCPKHKTKPKNNRAFWHRKLSANKTRDRLVTRTLRRAGWRVLRIWEHELAPIKTTATPLPGRSGEGAETRLLNRIRWALLDYEAIYAMDWNRQHANDPYAYRVHKARKCAEVLVPHVVETKFFIGAYVVDEAAKSKLQALGFDLAVTIDSEMFFR